MTAHKGSMKGHWFVSAPRMQEQSINANAELQSKAAWALLYLPLKDLWPPKREISGSRALLEFSSYIG